MNPSQLVAIEALSNCLGNLEETIAHLHFMTVSGAEMPSREQLQDEISALDSIADVMRQALDELDPNGRKDIRSPITRS